MKLIAHRGNINGPNKNENHPDYIMKAISLGFYVEIDLWKTETGLFLGHDCPQYETTVDFLKNKKLYVHAKNIPALKFLVENNINCFSHNVDDAVLTLRGEIWTFPGKELTEQSICVMPEMYTTDWSNLVNQNILGICSDYVGEICEKIIKSQHFYSSLLTA